jgi:2-dehydro-3-deoxyglucarate aldolase
MSLKQKLKNNEPAIGGWVMIGHEASAEIMARAGFDWVCIDLEHTATDLRTAENLIRAIEIGGAEALVRITNNDENLIKRVMDSGAKGIIVPMVRTAEDMKAAVNALYYPPKGTRGVGLARGQKYGAPGAFDAYKKQEDTVCIAQIEHIDAVNNLEEILSVEGVDGYFLGPYDLSASMGLTGQTDHPDVLAAMDKVFEIGKKLGKAGGLHVVEADEKQLVERVKQGFTFIAYSIDTRILDKVCRSGVTAAKGA